MRRAPFIISFGFHFGFSEEWRNFTETRILNRRVEGTKESEIEHPRCGGKVLRLALFGSHLIRDRQDHSPHIIRNNIVSIIFVFSFVLLALLLFFFLTWNEINKDRQTLTVNQYKQNQVPFHLLQFGA